MTHRILQLAVTLATCLTLTLTLFAGGDENASEATPPSPITQKVSLNINLETGGSLEWLTDGTRYTGFVTNQPTKITVEPEREIIGLYLIWDVYPSDGITISGQNLPEQTHNSGFFQEYIPLSSPTREELVLTLGAGAYLCEVSAYAPGPLPDDVHHWQPPYAQADILLLPTRAGDEHLYFGGILPTYAGTAVSVQVAYFMDHQHEPYRQQELLDGLWAVGVRNYPVIGVFPDIATDSLEEARDIFSEDEIMAYQAELLARFHPQVVIANSQNGEYGDGANQLATDCLIRVVGQSEFAPNKLYLHLYQKNPIVLNCDQPLPRFGAKTAFELSQTGFWKHASQLGDITVAKTGQTDMRKFGLYHTTVGFDTKNDILEHIIPYQTQSFQQFQLESVENSTELEQTMTIKATEHKEKELYLPKATSDTMVAFVGNPIVAALIAIGVAIFAAAVFLAPFVRRMKDRRK